MLTIVKSRRPVKFTEYTIEFRYKDDPEAGFTFPATRHGEPDIESMPSEMLANYEACLTDERLTEGEFNKHEWNFTHPAIGVCVCGKDVVLDCDYAGAVRCECGRWYNLFGQSLKDPKYWEEDYYDE